MKRKETMSRRAEMIESASQDEPAPHAGGAKHDVTSSRTIAMLLALGFYVLPWRRGDRGNATRPDATTSATAWLALSRIVAKYAAIAGRHSPD